MSDLPTRVRIDSPVIASARVLDWEVRTALGPIMVRGYEEARATREALGGYIVEPPE